LLTFLCMNAHATLLKLIAWWAGLTRIAAHTLQ
jgi:hypothetical protein